MQSLSKTCKLLTRSDWVVKRTFCLHDYKVICSSVVVSGTGEDTTSSNTIASQMPVIIFQSIIQLPTISRKAKEIKAMNVSALAEIWNIRAYLQEHT